MVKAMHVHIRCVRLEVALRRVIRKLKAAVYSTLYSCHGTLMSYVDLCSADSQSLVILGNL